MFHLTALIWVWFQRSCPPAQVKCQSWQWPTSFPEYSLLLQERKIVSRSKTENTGNEGRFPFRKKTWKFRWEQKWNFRLVKSCSIWSLTPVRHGARRWTWNWYKLRETEMEHDISFGNSNRENVPTFLDFPLFLRIFQWEEPTKRVPFTAKPKIPEILTKRKAPKVGQCP